MANRKITYQLHPGLAMMEAIIRNLEAKTGKTLEEWTAVLKKQGPAAIPEQKKWLKERYDLGGSTIGVIVDHARGADEELNSEAYLKKAPVYVDELFSGAKAHLRPICDELLALATSFGGDVKVSPCKTFVPLYRKHVFGQVKPTTQTRVDLGLALGDTKTNKLLIDTGGLAKKDRITRRIELTSVGDIDAEVKKWLKAAYDRDAN
jgi:Domain of unknown function (DUF5655)/Domain of unknown function (DUF4287)